MVCLTGISLKSSRWLAATGQTDRAGRKGPVSAGTGELGTRSPCRQGPGTPPPAKRNPRRAAGKSMKIIHAQRTRRAETIREKEAPAVSDGPSSPPFVTHCLDLEEVVSQERRTTTMDLHSAQLYPRIKTGKKRTRNPRSNLPYVCYRSSRGSEWGIVSNRYQGAKDAWFGGWRAEGRETEGRGVELLLYVHAFLKCRCRILCWNKYIVGRR
mmetsp:Transcript_21368/g.35760  ORF Transcript_21368/g.35760 Transcript_21368/m.35760 type:complete len:212 (-) Transcript_21368:2494-3129(-)